MAKRSDAPPLKCATKAERVKRPEPDVPKATPPKRKGRKVEASPELSPKASVETPPAEAPPAETDTTDDPRAIFGENLKAARLRSGLLQSDVAKRAGLTQQRLSLIESGQQNLTLKTMMRLAQVVDHNVVAMLLRVKARGTKE